MFFAAFFFFFYVTCLAQGNVLLLNCTFEEKEYAWGQQHDLPGLCSKNMCEPNNIWTRIPCGQIALSAGYQMIPEDTSKPYPECCPRAVPIEDEAQLLAV